MATILGIGQSLAVVAKIAKSFGRAGIPKALATFATADSDADFCNDASEAREAMDGMRLELAAGQLRFARQYTGSLLEGIREEDWFRQPEPAVTHLAWQVGHLAMAEYGLCLFRIRGRQPEDTTLMSSRFRKAFSRGSTPEADPAKNPTPGEIHDVFRRVHDQVLREMAGYREQDLAEPIDEPYAVYGNKLGAILFCSHHEMLHAGQIGLLRRLLGYSPVR